MGFFQHFNFDTLLALISCIAGIIALFIGGTAYKNCKIKNSSIKTNKQLENGNDNSLTVCGDLTYNAGISESGLVLLQNLTNQNFSMALNNAYTMFQEKCDENLRQIIIETNRIVSEQKLCIAGYTKLDWIQIYFESAKNTSDSYMQIVWAKVLAKELSEPNSFCYKTLETLKNMSEKEFRLFENLCSINIDGVILRGDYLPDMGLNWINLQTLKEYGLINLEGSKQTTRINAKSDYYLVVNNQYLIIIKNLSEAENKITTDCFLLTNVAKELFSISSKTTEEAIAINLASIIRSSSKNCSIELHKISSFDGTNVEYNDANLLK